MKTPLGWEIAFTGSGRRIYRNSVGYGTGFYLEVIDDGSIGGARQACVRGYSSATGFNSGLDPTPTVSQMRNGSIVAKSNALSGDAREWIIIGDCRCIYLFINSFSSGASNMRHAYAFGDFLSVMDYDPLGWFISTNGISGEFTGDGDIDNLFLSGGGGFDEEGGTECYFPRSYTGITGAVTGYVSGLYQHKNWNGWASSNYTFLKPYPYPVTGGLCYTRAQLYQGGIFLRGTMPGLIVPLHAKPLADGQLIDAPAELRAGTKLLAVNYSAEIWASLSSTGTGVGQLIFEIDVDWFE